MDTKPKWGYTKPSKFPHLLHLKNNIKYRFKNSIIDTIRYGIKNYFSIISGYSHLAMRSRNSNSQYFLKIKNYSNRPFYICAEFKNKRHIPLPLILDSTKAKGLQRLVIKWGIKSGKLDTAIEDCENYIRKHKKLKKKYHRD